MKFLLDANIPFSTKKLFTRLDRAVHVRDIGFQHAKDKEILERSSSESAVLITRDLEFANVIVYPIETHTGVIVIRVPPHFTAKNINDVLARFFYAIDKKLLFNAITIVEPARYRIRR